MTDERRDPVRQFVDWGAVGDASWRYAVDHTTQFVRSPRIDAPHYREQEQLYVDWVGAVGRAGMPAPNLMVVCLLWLAGIGFAFLLPGRWLFGFVLATVAWMARAFFIDREEGAPTAANSDENPPFEVPVP